METTYIFKRVERKYLLDEVTKKRLLHRMQGKLLLDEYGKSTICSLYLDTPDHRIIRDSIDADAYKEKLRLRSYGTPRLDSTVYLELKKKFEGVVYKRRVSLSLADAKSYLIDGKRPEDTQIWREIDYAMEFYGWPKPAMLIAYEREAYAWTEDPSFRVTFDSTPRARDTALLLERGSGGFPLLATGLELMEVKTAGAMPLPFAEALNELGIHPTSFSKYGTAYLHSLEENTILPLPAQKGAMQYVSNL
ncbi:MAG: polyphosphate polymerase domain-containing protein [Clostridia bacterium]|nr:polyphosphate polymerase domain-containing protein [Clostridia bacterium]